MNKNRIVFLTGATGLVASFLLKLLLENGNKVYALARSKKNQSAKDRVIALLRFWNTENLPKVLKNLEIIEGDITLPQLGMSSGDLKKLTSEVEIIFHSAALAELRAELSKIRKINVGGTQNVLDFALSCKPLKKVNHISTAYVVGTKNGIDFSENMLDVGQDFHNTYEQTKYEAELLVHDYQKKGMNISIFRPSMVMGSSKDGKTTNFRLFYEPLHFFSKEIYNHFPANPECFQNFVNVDTAAEAIFLLGERKESDVYHISNPGHTEVGFLMETAARYFGFKLPEFIPIQKFDFTQWTPVQKLLAAPFVPYFNFNTKIISTRTQNILLKYRFEYPEINIDNFDTIYGYCNRMSFIKKKN